MKGGSMKRSMFLSLCLVAVALVTLGANNSCKAPLDTTGEYSGTWTFNYKEGGTIIDTKDCDCTMTLDQDVDARPYPSNLILTGTLKKVSTVERLQIQTGGFLLIFRHKIWINLIFVVLVKAKTKLAVKYQR